MIELLIIADTHMTDPSEIPDRIIERATAADVILHAGDMTTRSIPDKLREYSDLLGVHGNMDDLSVQSVYPATRLVELDGVRIGLMHGSGSPERTVRLAERMFDDVDLIVFGHTHQPLDRESGGVRLFNPGSVSRNRGLPGGTFGWVEISDGSITTRIERMDGSLYG